MRQWFILIAIIISGLNGFAQNCTCESNFAWVKKTFEENDAGFRYVLEKKGQEAYDTHNNLTAEKIKAAKNLYECTFIINDWLHFFRKRHIGFIMTSDMNVEKLPETEQNWETFTVDTTEFKNYLNSKQNTDYEWIFSDGGYTIGVKKSGNEYIGFIIDTQNENWKPNEVKFRIIPDVNIVKSIYYMGNKVKIEENNAVELWQNFRLKIGNFSFNRVFPNVLENQRLTEYFKIINVEKPFLENVDVNTLYLRLPSKTKTMD